MIRRDRNHPSVIIWSVGNEEWAIEGNEKGARLTATMQSLAHRLDPTNAAAYAAEGMTHLLASEWQAAGPSFERAIALDSTYAMAHRAYTSALYQSGKRNSSAR